MVLTGAQLALCVTIKLFFGGLPLMYVPAPRGDCENCCPIRDAKDIQFYLYTRRNPEVPFQLFPSDKKRFLRSEFNTSQPLVIYMHGFSESAAVSNDGQSSTEIRDAFLETGDYNVILVDWSPITALPWYTSAVQNGPRVGRYIARFLRFLFTSGNVSVKKTHVIGFSLGAEVAGFVGKTLKEWGITLPRITGLDPAFPLYSDGGTRTRLSHEDAKFVDVIHTDGGVFGYPWPLGHADFFPNGGVPLQPGCVESELSKNQWLSIILGCSHGRAWEYFVESVRSPYAFPSESCKTHENFLLESCPDSISPFMGIKADKRLRGRYYLETNSAKPYGRKR